MPKTRLISPGIANHSLKKNLILNDNYLSNDGGDEGIRIDDDGNVGIGTGAPAKALHVVNSALVKGRATFTLTGSINPTGTNVNVPGTGTKFLTELTI